MILMIKDGQVNLENIDRAGKNQQQETQGKLNALKAERQGYVIQLEAHIMATELLDMLVLAEADIDKAKVATVKLGERRPSRRRPATSVRP